MSMSTGGAKGGLKNDINVTPLVDVVLVLLIIFMVITPMLQKGKSVTLPKAQNIHKHTKPPEEPIFLSVTSEHEMYLEQEKYNEADLLTHLSDKLAPNPGRPVMLKGDISVTFSDVRKVMHIAKKAGAKAIALGVEELKDQP